MTTSFSRVSGFRCLFLVLTTLFFTGKLAAQSDTLHLNYDNISTVPHDTTLAKLDAWIKKLNGTHVNINVYAYFSKPEFKKYAQQRADEMFLILNRKARSLFTIEFIGPKRGENSQRSRVDIVYQKAKTPEEIAAAAAEKAKEEAAKAEEKKKKDEEKAKKESAKKEEKAAKNKTEVAAEQTEKGGSDKKKGDEKKGDDKKSKDKGTKSDEDEEDDSDYGQASSRTYGEGYTMTLEELKYIKSAKFVVAQNGRKSIDDNLFNAVKNFWDFNPNVVQMPYDQARKLGKENKKDTMVILSFIQVRTWFTEKHGPVTLKLLKIGYALAIETGKGKLLVKQFIPKEKGKEPALTYFAFGVSFLNNLCHIMDDNQLSKSGKADEFFDLAAPQLKSRTLIVAESQVNPKLPYTEIPQYYTSPMSVVPDNVWEESILQKKDVAYVMVVLIPTNPKRFWHYIMDAKTGKVYLIDMGQAFAFSAGWGTPNFDPSHSGFVDKDNFQRYERSTNKAIEDNKERADDKAKDEEKKKEKAEKKEKENAAKEAKKAKKEEEKKEEPKKEKKKKEKEEDSKGATEEKK